MTETITKSSGNIFKDLGFEREEAENLRIRARLMMAIKEHIKTEGWTQQEAALRYGVAQPRISEIFKGKIELFTIDKLVNMLGRVGRRVDITIETAA